MGGCASPGLLGSDRWLGTKRWSPSDSLSWELEGIPRYMLPQTSKLKGCCWRVESVANQSYMAAKVMNEKTTWKLRKLTGKEKGAGGEGNPAACGGAAGL